MNSSPGRLLEGYIGFQLMDLGSNPCRETECYDILDQFPMMFQEDFYYVDDGNLSKPKQVLLNWKLAMQNKCSSDDMWNIVILHECRRKIFKDFRANPSYNKQQELVQELEDLEYDLQFFWHFPLDHNWHNWWWHVSGCKCSPHSYLGETRIISKDCKLHNSEVHAHED